MKKFSSYELTEFNIDGHIDLKEKCGLVKIMRCEDRKLVLVCDRDYRIIDSTTPIPGEIVNVYSLLGFVLDIGIRKEKELTFSDGLYFGRQYIPYPQSFRKISQTDFDPDLLEKIESTITALYQSGDPSKELAAVKMAHLFDTYNNARLLYPNFYHNSYLDLFRILDALSGVEGRYNFAVWVANISAALNKEIYQKIATIAAYSGRLQVAEDLFNECLKEATQAQKKPWPCASLMSSLDQYGRLIFSCFYATYEYRNKFVHQGFPFPDIIKEAWGLENDEGTAYLHPSEGSAFIKTFRPSGLQQGDTLDIHEVIVDKQPNKIKTFKEKYFLLIPSWHFLKRITRTALIGEISKL